MREWIANKILDRFARRYDYDVSYMRAMLKDAPDAFFAFAKINDASAYRRLTPIEAFYAVKLTGTLSEDCGPCAQLVVNMAQEAGVAAEQIAAVARRDENAMHRDTALGFHFAAALVRRLDNEDGARAAVHAAWGDAGVAELAMALAITRVFPMLKAGMGYAKECRRLRVGGADVDVVKEAA